MRVCRERLTISTMNPLRLVFFGTAELACPSLLALAASPEFEVAVVVTQPDRPKGRSLQLQPSPVKTAALGQGLSVLQPARARDPAFLATVRELRPALGVVVAYGQILPRALLDIPAHGFVNVHTSLLPKHRGAAPIQWALLNDDPETGVTIMQIDEGLDTGGILAQQATPIHVGDNARTLHDRLAQMGAALLLPTIMELIEGRITPRRQPEAGAGYARKITKEDGRIDWSLPARAIWNRVRAFTPWPGAYTFLSAVPKPQLLKIWHVEVTDVAGGQAGQVTAAGPEGIVVTCGQQALRILTLQLEGSRRMTAREFLAGHTLTAGQLLG
jgi:methionyl-tRNA formyltransferase